MNDDPSTAERLNDLLNRSSYSEYSPEPDPEPEYQPEPSGDGYVPPSEPPVKRGGLSWWQKAVIYAVAPVAVVAFLGYNALKPQQAVPVSTPTPVVATATPAPTATYTPTSTITPIPTATKVPVTRETRTPLETLLKDYPAEIAALINGQTWFVDGLDGMSEYLILGYGSELAKPGVNNYLLGKFLLEGKEKNMIVVYDDGLEEVAQNSVSFLQAKLPIAQEFIRVPVNWSLLFVHLQKAEKGKGSAGASSYGGIADLNAKYSGYSDLEYTLGHEAGHLMLDQDLKGTTLWYNETMAEMERYFMLGGEEALEQRLAFLDQTRSRRIITKPLAEFNLDDHLGNPAKGIKPTAEHITRGLDLLLNVRKRLGHYAFENAIIDSTKINQSRELTSNDIRELLLLYTPEPLKAEIASIYDAAVFGATK